MSDHPKPSRVKPTTRYHVTGLQPPCPTCGGTGQRATAQTANGRDLERHERNGTTCDDCNGTGCA